MHKCISCAGEYTDGPNANPHACPPLSAAELGINQFDAAGKREPVKPSKPAYKGLQPGDERPGRRDENNMPDRSAGRVEI